MLQARTSTPALASGIEAFVAGLRLHIEQQAPQLLTHYDTYAAEASFGRQWLDKELVKLPLGSSILEIGAGMFLLACQLQREGFSVTALEPVGGGFSHFHQLQEQVISYAREHGALPILLRCTAEELYSTKHYDFAYSLNVMEHVADVTAAITRIMKVLKPQARYRFVCPNYAFPFETHFKIPILWNKVVTFYVFQTRILTDTSVEDPQGLWDSLNWITVGKLQRLCAALTLQSVFDPAILTDYVGRAMHDSTFSTRHQWIHRIIHTLQKIGLLRLLRLIPVRLMPVMDCTLTQAMTRRP